MPWESSIKDVRTEGGGIWSKSRHSTRAQLGRFRDLLTRGRGLTKNMEGRNEIELWKIPDAIIALPFRDETEMEPPFNI